MTAIADHSAFLNRTQTKDRTMTTLFPTGQLVARSDFLSLIPRSAMIQAIVRHVTNARPVRNGAPIRSEHRHGRIGFHILTIEDRTKTLLRLDEASIRLACASCDRDDTDGITPEQLEQARAQGWTGIEEVQSYDDSMQTCDNPDDAPAGSDITAWDCKTRTARQLASRTPAQPRVSRASSTSLTETVNQNSTTAAVSASGPISLRPIGDIHGDCHSERTREPARPRERSLSTTDRRRSAPARWAPARRP
jgi:hypothetical protein